jgi:hypothetical protein
MKQEVKNKPDLEMLDEYDFSGGVRGKYAGRFPKGCSVVVLDPDMAERFPDSESVNQALRALVKTTPSQSDKTHP